MRLALGAALLLAAAGSARGDGDRALSLGGGYATFSAQGKPGPNGQTPTPVSPSWGLSLDGVYEHGISTDLSLRAEGLGAVFSGGTTSKKQSPHSFAAVGDVGAVFRFDVLRYVPYAFAGVGGLVATGGPLSTTGLVLAIGGGLDVLLDRHRSIGFEVRLASFGSDVSVATFGVRVSSRWGTF